MKTTGKLRLLLLAVVFLSTTTGRSQYGSDQDDYPKNKNPFCAWNDPIHRDDPFAPHNSAIGKIDPFKPWNSPLGNNDDLTSEEREAYGLPTKSSNRFNTDDTDYPKNRNPTAPWNSPLYRDSPTAPHNNPVYKSDPTKPWNTPTGNIDDLTPNERKAYGL